MVETMVKKSRIISAILAISLFLNILSPATIAIASNQGVVNAESKLNGVTYKMRPDVVTMPEGISYDLEEEEVLTNTEELDLDNIESMAIRKKRPTASELDTRVTKKYIQSRESDVTTAFDEPEWSNEKEFLPKSIKVDRNTNNSLTPKVGKIFFDPANQTVMKVTGDPTTDASGMTTIPVEQPDISELVETLDIPKQTIDLSNDDISYINNEVIMMTDIYSQGIDEIRSLSTTGREPMVEIDLSGLDLIDESTDKSHKEAFEAKLEAIKNDSSLNGFEKAAAIEQAKKEEKEKEKERESELKYKAKVEITEGTLKVYEPTLTAYAKWGIWGDFEAEASANIDVESDLLIDGDLNISKQVEILIYGYDIDFEIGKIYAGVYLVLGLNGSITFQIRIQQEGTVKVGAKAVGWLIPMAAYPIVEYDHKKFDTAVTASGELKLWSYAMPKAGIELFGVKILSATFKIGLEANVKLDISSQAQSIRLWVDLIIQLNALVFGYNVDILDKRFNIYDKTWAHTKGESIGGGTNIDVASGYAYLTLEKVDAARDIISGTAFRSATAGGEPVPCNGEEVMIYITHADGTKSDTPVKVNSKGEFELKTPITPLDRVGASYTRTDPKNKYKAAIPLTNVQPPYTLTYLYPDAFNSRISGEINGEKYGPDGIAINGDEVKFTKPIDIIVEKLDKTKKTYKVTPNSRGEFVLENIDLFKGDKILSQLIFEDAQIVSESNKPELGLEIYLDVKKDDRDKVVSISGAIQNMYGSNPYLGDVVLVGSGSEGNTVTKAKSADEALKVSQKATEGVKIIKGGTIPKMIKAVNSSPSSLFEFKDIVYTNLKGLAIKIEYNGVTLVKQIVPAATMPIPPTLEKAVVSPVEAYIEKRINYAFNKNMKLDISKQQLALQNAMFKDGQSNAANINFSQNNGISYTMSMIADPPTSDPQEYSFREGEIDLVAKPVASSISLTWNEPKDAANIKGYNVYRGTEADGESLTPINSTLLTTPKYVDKNVKARTKYYYMCSIVYDNGDEFIISNEASATARLTKR